jgi:lantibiotic biosynthesis protein
MKDPTADVRADSRMATSIAVTENDNRKSRRWAFGVNADRRQRARDWARLIGERVTRPEILKLALDNTRRQSQFPSSSNWSAWSTAQGEAGIALVANELGLAYPNDMWKQVAISRLDTATKETLAHGSRSASLTGGLSGLAFTATQVGPPERFASHRTILDRHIAQAMFSLISEVNTFRPLAPAVFDVISGLSGITLYLLPQGDRKAASKGLPFAAGALADLAQRAIPVGGSASTFDVPAWYTPPGLLYDDTQRRVYPHGNLNCGLAHGAPGMLAALALAMMEGQQSNQIVSAVESLAVWLSANCAHDHSGPRWPFVIPVEQYGVQHSPVGATRDAWCYGTPGVARALYLAGVALDESTWRDLAVDAMLGVFRRTQSERRIDSSTFCHGVAGLLQITLRFAFDTELLVFEQASSDLLDLIFADLDADNVLGVTNLEPGGGRVDQPGILDGASGVCLALLSASAEMPPRWDRMFALS